MATDPLRQDFTIAPANLGKNKLSANLRVNFAENVKEEWLHVKVECLVVQEQLGQEAEVLAVQFVHFSICFPNGECAFTVNLFAWRLTATALT